MATNIIKEQVYSSARLVRFLIPVMSQINAQALATRFHDDRHIQRIKKRCNKFRILIMGRANAGKTTILRQTCNTTDDPEIYDAEGGKVRMSKHSDPR